MIKTKVDKLEDIPEALREFYVERDGKFLLQTDEASNLKNALESENEEVRKLKLTLAEYRSKLESLEKEKEKQQLNEGDIEAVIESRLAKYKQDFELKLSAETALKNSLMSSALKAELKSNALRAGVNPNAVDDVVLRGLSVFSVGDDGSIVAMRDGQKALGKDGKSLYSVNEWLEEIKPNTAHWYADQNKGGAASGVKSSTGKNITVSRGQFDKMSAHERVTFAKEGGSVTD